jgi:membrane associated rhomboid family serine protease
LLRHPSTHGISSIVRRVTEPGDDHFRDPQLDAALATPGPLSTDVARRLIERGRAKLEASEPMQAAADFQRAVGHEDPAITGAALLGLGDALYRLDNEPQAGAAWTAVTRMPDNPSTYQAWRNLAGVLVRAGDLTSAVEAYRQADRRAPAEDKPEIAARLGWLAKETGNAGAANRYFARSRPTVAGIGISLIVLAVTVVISFLAESSPQLLQTLWLDRSDVLDGQLYRLASVTLVHDGPIHLFFNMYALYVVGPIVEQAWGKRLFVFLYLLTAVAASTASFLNTPGPAVGASGAIFGLVGVILAGTRAHHPMLDRRARAIVPQLGMFVLINLAFGFAVGGLIDNAAHVGGLVAGLWLGFVVPPGKVPTLRSAWQNLRGEPAQRSPLLVAAGVLLLVGVIFAALAVGFETFGRLR